MEMEFKLHTLAEVEFLAKKLHQEIKPCPNRATIIGLYGDLGAGKTTFTKFLAVEYGIEDQITSPTFILERSYALSNKLTNVSNKSNKSTESTDMNKTSFTRFIHIDAYRLNDGSSVEALKLAEKLADPKALIVIEWPEFLKDLSLNEQIKIYFRHVDGGDEALIRDIAVCR